MSKVTTVMLYTGETCDDLDAKIDEVNARLLEIDGGRHPDDGTPRYWLENLSKDARIWGGTKAGGAVWGGAFNHFPFMAFLRILLTVHWANPQAFSLMVHFDEYEDWGFALYNLDDVDDVVADRVVWCGPKPD